VTTQPRAEAAAPRSLVSNSSALLAARIYGVAAGGILAVVTVRVLSVQEYGRYATAMAIIVVVGVIAELGISALATRQIALDEEHTARILGVALSAEIATATVGAALLVPLGLALGYPASVIVILALGSLLVLAQGALAALSGAFQARRVFHLFALCSALQATVMLGGGIAALVAGTGAAGLVASAGLAYLAAAVGALILLRRRLDVRPMFAGAHRRILAFLREAAPIALVASISVIYGRIALLLLSKLGDERAVAVYNLPLTIVELTYLVPAAIATAFYPLFTRQLADDRQDAERSLDLLLRLFAFGSVPLALVLGLGGTDLIVFVFGDRYADSGTVMAVLAGTVVANFFNYLAWYGLLAGRRERRRVPAVMVGLALNVALSVVLIPRHGARGAAIALVASDAFMVGWLLVTVHRQVIALRLGAVVLRALPAAGAATAVALLPLPGDGIVRGLAAGAAWIGVMLATRYIGPGEWEPLTAPLRRSRQSRAKR
jgi:O-antigen/teichoic acid export membrane protein